MLCCAPESITSRELFKNLLNSIKMKVFQIRAKITVPASKSFFMKGCVLADAKSKAQRNLLLELSAWIEKEGYPTSKIEVIECKQLRTDFLMTTKD